LLLNRMLNVELHAGSVLTFDTITTIVSSKWIL
jgi:hypothetical protein